MMIPTIKIQSSAPDGYTIINEEDFDASQHQRYEESQSTTENEGSTFEQNSPLDSPRQAELEALYETEGYRAIQAIAEPLGIEKPKGGWRDAIPLIVESEQGEL